MKGDKKNVILERRKPKKPQKENLLEVDGRDTFQTPNYAVDLLVPFLEDITPMSPFGKFRIWECAAGLGKIVKRLQYHQFDVIATDLVNGFNFLTDIMSFPFDCIVTNPPYSLKKKFYLKCKEFKVPFALLIPADYSGWIVDAVRQDGAEKIIPTRRIDYITPNVLCAIHEGEVYRLYGYVQKLKDFKVLFPELWTKMLNEHKDYCVYESIYDAPARLLNKYSSSQFHSMWLTWGFGLGKSETFVELTNEMKDNV